MSRRSIGSIALPLGCGLALALLLVAGTPGLALDPEVRPITKGRYRLPYADGTAVRISRDHDSHRETMHRYDMGGEGTGPFTIVAAAAGTIVCIEEDSTLFCPRDPCPASHPSCCQRDDPSCKAGCRNNFVWLRHPNGEYSKYSHIQTGSASAAGRTVGEIISAGTPLGREGDVGFASGPHLHFEVADLDEGRFATRFPGASIEDVICAGSGFIPSDGIRDDVIDETSSPPDMNDTPDDDLNRQNRIVAFCDIGFVDRFDLFTAAACERDCPAGIAVTGRVPAPEVSHRQADISISSSQGVTLLVDPFAGLAMQAGTRITLRPGFHADRDSYFSATINRCDAEGGY